MKQLLAIPFLFLGMLTSLVMAGDAWPQFRGSQASGIAHGQNLPESWDVKTSKNLAWKREIPGQSNASPIIWDQRVFIVTAIGGAGNPQTHSWEVWSIHLQSGEVLWREVAHSTTADPNRRIYDAYAHSTPVTDGKVVVALFGSEGIHTYSVTGKKLWSKSLGTLNVGAYNDINNEWGHASSPILENGILYFQCDTANADFLVAMDSMTGKEIWRVVRDELPSWGTPTFVPGTPSEIITNGSNLIRGYHATTGEELWRLGGSSKQTLPTPVFSQNLILVASGEHPIRPIFAIKRGARGDLTLDDGKTSGSGVAWSKKDRGAYAATPIIVGDLVYSIHGFDELDCYELATGAEVYRDRLPNHGGGFTASPVSADGMLYFCNEGGDIFTVPVGRNFKITATNTIEEPIMATPAIAQGTLILRGNQHLYAISKP